MELEVREVAAIIGTRHAHALSMDSIAIAIFALSSQPASSPSPLQESADVAALRAKLNAAFEDWVVA